MRVLAVGAHPDDCELGAGATLAQHAIDGDEVKILVLTTGATSRLGADEDDASKLREQAEAAAGVLGAGLRLLSYPDQELDRVRLLELVRDIEISISTFKPGIVYSHSRSDLNLDHEITARAVATACRPLPGSTVRRLYAFEVVSSSEWGMEAFHPTTFVEAHAEAWQRKLDALSCYPGEMRPAPHPRSVEGLTALALWRGMTAGVPMAEAFEVVRMLR